MSIPHYERLTELLGFPESERFLRILRMVMSEEEALWLTLLPATPGQLAQQLRCTADEARGRLHDLVMKGFAFPGEDTPTGQMYERLSIGCLGDLVLADARYEHLGPEFYDAWKAFFNEERVFANAQRAKEQPSTPHFRVLPAEAALPVEGVADHERASSLLAGAERIAVMPCPCRRRERRCEHEHDVCMSFDEIADFGVKRGTAHYVTHEEALDILARCEEHGLLHNTENTREPRILCNCCADCCVFLRPRVAYGLDLPVAVNRFQAVLDVDLCVDCGACLERCSFGALSAGGGAPSLQAERCVGCGLCAVVCPSGALSLQALRPEPELLEKGNLSSLRVW